MTSNATTYAVYRTAAVGEQVAGTVVNRIVWDGVSDYRPGAGLALIADPAGKYPIGSAITAA